MFMITSVLFASVIFHDQSHDAERNVRPWCKNLAHKFHSDNHGTIFTHKPYYDCEGILCERRQLCTYWDISMTDTPGAMKLSYDSDLEQKGVYVIVTDTCRIDN